MHLHWDFSKVTHDDTPQPSCIPSLTLAHWSGEASIEVILQQLVLSLYGRGIFGLEGTRALLLGSGGGSALPQPDSCPKRAWRGLSGTRHRGRHRNVCRSLFAGILLSWESLARALEGKLLYALHGDFFKICGFKEITSETQL